MRGSSCKSLTVKDLLFWIGGRYPASKVSFDLPRKYREEEISRYFLGRSKEPLLAGEVLA